MKRWQTWVVGGLALAFSVASAQSFREPAFPATLNDGKPTEITYWAWVPNMDKQAALFTKKYPNVKVTVVNLGGGQSGTYPKLQTALKAGTGAPDVAQVEFGYIPFFASTGGLADLSSLISPATRSFFPAWAWNQVSPDGKSVFGVPQDTGPFAMIYRKDLFDKYGVKIPTTWDEYAAAGKMLYDKSGGKVKIGNFFSTFAPWFTALVWAGGGQMWSLEGDGYKQSLNNAVSKKVANYWGDLIKKGYVSTLPAFSQDFWNAVAAGQVATSMEAAWGTGSFAGSLAKNPGKDAQYRVAPLPQWSKGALQTGNWGGSTAVVTKQSKNPQIAATFAVWLMTSQASLVAGWNGAGLFPAANAGLTLPQLADAKRDPVKFFGGQNVVSVYAQAANSVNTKFAWSPWAPTVDASFQKQVDLAIKGQISWDAAMDAWQSETLAKAKADGFSVK
jgi:multiple sugar transport system substrate-binding protein